MSGCRLRLWRFGRGRLRPVAQCHGVEAPEVTVDETGAVRPVPSGRHVVPLPGLEGYWFEVAAAAGDPAGIGRALGPVLGPLLDRERETLHLAKQLASRVEEIELLYTISEVLSRSVGVRQAAQTILEEVSAVVGARRASLFVYHEPSARLRAVAAVGKARDDLSDVAPDDSRSITARVFRERRIVAFDPRRATEPHPGVGGARGYRGAAFISVPILYPTPEGPARPIGVMNLTDRLGTDAFSGGERRLVSAVAHQIGAAIEHARLVERDVARQRLERELELAHDLQRKLLPQPSVLGGGVDVAARCEPAERVGGDFYHFLRLPGSRIGVMLGDVSSHGFAAALVMALVRSAAGIHAEEAAAPDDALRGLLASVAPELRDTEMFLTLFYGVVDPDRGMLRYANAGHPHAFRVAGDGSAARLGATSPPLGITSPEQIAAAQSPWTAGDDLLLLFSDGLTDARDARGERFGEERILRLAAEGRRQPSHAIADAIMAAVDMHEPAGRDDRTVLVLRT